MMSPLFKDWKPPKHRAEGPPRVVVAYRVSGRVHRDYMRLATYQAYRAECLSRYPHRWDGKPAMLVGDLTKLG